MPELSILIPSIPERHMKVSYLMHKFEQQIAGRDVEVLAFVDNMKRSIGLKRDGLLQLAKGDYLAFVDDDDLPYENYVGKMLGWIKAGNGADVISIQQHATMNGSSRFLVDFSIKFENEEARKFGGEWQDVKRKPFQTCAWKREIAQRHHFPDASYGEDWHWCKRVLEDVKTEYYGDTPIMCYRWSQEDTRAELVYPEDSK